MKYGIAINNPPKIAFSVKYKDERFGNPLGSSVLEQGVSVKG